MPATASTAPPSIRLLPGTPVFGLESAQRHLEAGGLARQKWPEELRFVEDFPRTPSGKIQKNVLRSALRAAAGHDLPFEVRPPSLGRRRDGPGGGPARVRW